MFPNAFEESACLQHLGLGAAEFAFVSRRDLAAELRRHHLLAVADAEDRHARVEEHFGGRAVRFHRGRRLDRPRGSPLSARVPRRPRRRADRARSRNRRRPHGRGGRSIASPASRNRRSEPCRDAERCFYGGDPPPSPNLSLGPSRSLRRSLPLTQAALAQAPSPKNFPADRRNLGSAGRLPSIGY